MSTLRFSLTIFFDSTFNSRDQQTLRLHSELCEVVLELWQVYGAFPFRALYWFSVAKQHHGWQAVNAVLLHQLRVGINLDFNNLHFIRPVLRLGFFNNLADQLTRAAPRGPEVHEDGDLGLDGFRVCRLGLGGGGLGSGESTGEYGVLAVVFADGR